MKIEKLVEEMNKCHVLVLPSLAQMEAFGMVFIEAMACKTPIIGTKIGGIPEVISNNKDGFLVPPSNADALKQAIKKIISNKDLAKRMGENGYVKVHKIFTWKVKTLATMKVFNEYLN